VTARSFLGFVCWPFRPHKCLGIFPCPKPLDFAHQLLHSFIISLFLSAFTDTAAISTTVTTFGILIVGIGCWSDRDW
jgi:hypothetical protein